MNPTYVTREQFQAAADVRTTSLRDSQIDRILQTASRRVENQLHRHFYPLTAAKTFQLSGGGPGFWLNADLYSLTSATVDGTAADTSDVDLYPAQYGPPYSWIELMGAEVSITGVWGYSNDTESAGALDAAVSTTTGTSISVTDSSKIGVGDLITIDSERFVVTGKAIADTGANLAADLTAVDSDVSVSVDDGTLVHVGEIITVDSERMLITAITSNTLTVVRAFDGSTLATHDGIGTPASLYAGRTLTVERGATGTTAATHADTTAITRNVAPYEIQAVTMAEALNMFHQETAAYARTIGTGENERESFSRGLVDARKEARRLRRIRQGAI